MKVILLRDVARIGRKSEVKEVPDGHAINFLIPRKLAVSATGENIKRHTQEVFQNNLSVQKEDELFENSLKVLGVDTVTYTVEANEKGHLFKGINVDDIVTCFNQRKGSSLTKKQVELDHPIKEVGIHEIIVSHKSRKGVVRLEVVKK